VPGLGIGALIVPQGPKQEQKHTPSVPYVNKYLWIVYQHLYRAVQGINMKGFKVLLNNEEEQSISQSPLK